MTAGSGAWREFDVAPGERASYEVTRVLYEGSTAFQSVAIVETRSYGLALFLDDAPQSSLADEFVYHEALVQPALVAHPRPRRVLICGGGEGATLREVLRHPTVERAVMVDIDGELVGLARRYLEPMHRGAFGDPRVEVVIGDAVAYLCAATERFDAIVVDLTDPSDDGPTGDLYGESFYRLAASRLEDGGIVAIQAYAFTPINLRWLRRVDDALGGIFPLVRAYRAEVPFFKDSWAFCVASHVRDPRALGDVVVDATLQARRIDTLRYYDGETHTAMFALPKYARRALERG